MRKRFLAVSVLMLVADIVSAEDFVGFRDGVVYQVQPQTSKRYQGVIRQQFDWSCAAASLATLVVKKYDMDAPPEQALFDVIVAPMAGNEADLNGLERNGLTLAHLQIMTASLGLEGQGVYRSLHGLLKSEPLPVIARISEPHPDEPGRQVNHWLVISEILGNRVVILDPVRGNRRMPIYQFSHVWLDGSGKGVLFRVERSSELFGVVSRDATTQQPIAR